MTQRIAIAFAAAACIYAQPLRSLQPVPVLETPGLDSHGRDKDALAALGKAFFWDMQAGGDDRTASASCHFHAGADHRRQNQIILVMFLAPAVSSFDGSALANEWDKLHKVHTIMVNFR